MFREKLGAQERSRPRQSSAESAPLAGRQTDAHHQNQNYRRKRATPSEAAYLARRIVPEQPFICCGQKLVTAHRQTAVLHTSVIFAAPTNPNSESINQSKQTNRKKKKSSAATLPTTKQTPLLHCCKISRSHARANPCFGPPRPAQPRNLRVGRQSKPQGRLVP